MDTTEKRFENDIEMFLLTQGGYAKGNQDTYNKEKAIDMPVLISFIEKTQSKVWQRYVNVYGEKAESQLYKVFQADVARYGLIHVLRMGIKDRGINIRFCYFAPASNMNGELVQKYNDNILTETRQFAYSTQNNNTIDMVLSLNGIPIIALELKNQLTGQSVDNAKRQFMFDRDPHEFIFQLNNRVLVCFCADLYEVAMTTELKGADTFFLPFNQGSNGAGNIGDGGNPANPNGYMSSYLWEKVLQREMLFSILQRYISKQESNSIQILIDENGKEKEVKSTSSRIIFPRYHQLDVVEKLIDDTKRTGAGHNYLIQHSAGSGKSNSIAWLTYRLASLHNDQEKNIFQTVFVITDRRVLNHQLQDTILGFDHMVGQIETIRDKDNSDKLKEAINDGRRIIITTLHRFPYIYKALDCHSGKNFAIIVDEAHSSQSGKSAEKLKAALADTDEALRELAELEEKAEEQLKNEMDDMVETLLTQGQHKNLSFYAFTATPKPKTLQTFGVNKGEGFDAYHHYSMRQAIDEEFILDVLKYYTTYQISYEIAKQVQDNPELEEPPATKAIKSYHDNHQFVLEQKVEIMVEKFREISLNKMNGKAKAMVVSPSRAHAVRYFFLVRDYCIKKGYTDVRPMVAFSGSVKYKGEEYTETKLNSTPTRKISEIRLPIYFSSDLFNVLIVADKYQTGFDEPKLHTMFVDKKLKGVKAVQTLSRLNRSQKGKEDTYVFDFVNSAEDIQKSFSPFYEDTLLDSAADLNLVYLFKNDIDQFHLWNISDEEKVYQIYSSRKQGITDMGRLASSLKPAIDAYNILTEENRFKVRSLIKNFIRFYAYMAQVVRTFDKELYLSYIYAEFLYRFIPKSPHETINLDNKIALINSKVTEDFSGSIKLAPSVKDKTLKGEKPKEGKKPEEKRDLLTNIIDKINIMFKGNFTEADRVIVETIYDRMRSGVGKKLARLAKKNDSTMFEQSIFPQEFDKVARGCYMEQMDAFGKLFENEQFYSQVMSEMAKAMYLNFTNESAQSVVKESDLAIYQSMDNEDVIKYRAAELNEPYK